LYRSLKFVWGYPTKFAGLTQNPKKNIRTPNQVCLVRQMCTGAKNSCGGYPTELAPGA
jgi:hypothetical protein